VARGWRPNFTTCKDMEANVAEAVKLMTKEDYVVVQCFDNITYITRSEEGGDLLIRKFTTGDYHIEDDLVLASKEQIFMYFKNCVAFF
jgi:hypothetical protein